MNDKQTQPDFDKYDYYLIVDLEATCSNNRSISKQEMEIIEIGAVMVDSRSLKAVDEYQTFIKPIRHPQLTSFCSQLTSITQSEVEDASTYPNAISEFKDWLYRYNNYLFCSWGDYDKRQFVQDCEFHLLPYPFSSGHVNVKKMFAQSQGFRSSVGMAGAMKKVGLAMEGTLHRGLDDARNIARLLPYIVGEKTCH